MGKIYNDLDSNMEENNTEEQNSQNLGIGVFVEPVENIMHREDEINRVYDIMNRVVYRSVILVGDTGIGKRSIIEGVANLYKNSGFPQKIISLDFDMMVSSVTQQVEFNNIIDKVFSTIIENDFILNINNMGHLLHTNCYANGGFSFLNHMIQEIEDKGIKLIATATTKELKDLEDQLGLLVDRCTVIKLTELTKEQTKDILDDEIVDFEEYHRVAFPKNITEIICDNADKYVKGHPFPLKAEELVDEVCSNICRKYFSNEELNTYADENTALKLELIGELENNNYERCEAITNTIEENEKKIQKINSNRKKIKVTENDVLEAIGKIVNVKMTKLSKDQSEFLRQMPVELKKTVIGQDDTIDKIVKNIRRNQLGLRKQAHSAGNFIFIGSTGVGKTHLAKALARYLYGSEENMLRFDMSEYQTEIDVTKLLGSAPGYVGYKESGLLVKRLAKTPECVMLFDEIEKAHPKVYDVLLQLLDEGKITGSDGKTVDGTKALIIFTSNIGVRSAKELSTPMGFTKDADALQTKKEESIMQKALRKRFSPEFINRLDSICYFNPLGRETLIEILNNELKEMNVQIKQITGKEVVLSENVNEWLIQKVEDEKNGARPIIRLLQQEIEEGIADLVVNDDELLKTKKKTLVAELVNDKIVLS